MTVQEGNELFYVWSHPKARLTLKKSLILSCRHLLILSSLLSVTDINIMLSATAKTRTNTYHTVITAVTSATIALLPPLRPPPSRRPPPPPPPPSACRRHIQNRPWQLARQTPSDDAGSRYLPNAHPPPLHRRSGLMRHRGAGRSVRLRSRSVTMNERHEKRGDCEVSVD